MSEWIPGQDASPPEAVGAWLDGTWQRAAAAVVLDGGDGGGPLAERRVRGEIFDQDGLAQLRTLTTTGQFLGDVCRCLGSLTIGLLDADGEFIGRGSLHAGTDVAWERGRFGNNLVVADPAGLALFLTGRGVFRTLPG
ncbi:hypothetical protein P8605_10820 [Streptomyces sp. T-3]|nr:hypothetical protein [Streptomyces sp. T-3]